MATITTKDGVEIFYRRGVKGSRRFAITGAGHSALMDVDLWDRQDLWRVLR